VVENIVRAAPGLLADDGWCQILANWIIAKDTPWDERLATWLVGNDEDVDAFVVQREVLDPAAYVELWLKDAGHHPATGAAHAEDYRHRYDTWLTWFEEQGIEAVGFGWINLRRTGEQPRHDLLSWPYDVEQPIAPAVGAWGAVAHIEVSPADVLLRAEDVQQETLGVPGAEDPTTVVLRQQRGLRRARRVDTVEAALVGACDGDLSLGQIIDALAQLLDLDAAEARATYLPIAEELVREGFLIRG
jgi:hypothetical protein